MDYDRLCAVLGRNWSYITPEFFYMEMDDHDVNKLVPLLDPGVYEACWIGREQRKHQNLKEAEADGVITRKG